MTALLLLVFPFAEESGGDSVNHVLSYGIGLIVFGIFTALMLGLLAFGKGREHS